MLNIAVEYNGLYWHSDEFKDKEYHKEKMNDCNKLGIKLIQIFEDEWTNYADIVKSRLRSYIGINDIIYARKCKIVELTSVEANAFIKRTHLQGTGRSNQRYGLTYNSELVAVMTFLNSDISKNVIGWELNRFSTKEGINIVGGASKLFRHFISQVNPESITTFADLRWSNLSTFYSAIGFVEHSITSVNYWYIPQNEVRRLHRYALKSQQTHC